jgi:hypothetical protein
MRVCMCESERERENNYLFKIYRMNIMLKIQQPPTS